MTTDADRLFDLDEALGKIGRLAFQAWNNGTPAFDEVIEEVVLTCDSLMDGRTDETLRGEIEAVLPETWCPDLPFQERLRNLIEVRRPYLSSNKALQTRISELEVMQTSFGDPPLAVDPDAVVRLRLLLRNNPRSVVLAPPLIELLQCVFGISSGPTVIEPAIVCPACAGDGVIGHAGPTVPCARCDGEGKVPDVDAMRLRIAELEHERLGLREVLTDADTMMRNMHSSRSHPPHHLWEALDRSLANYRNNGYENSDHPDDFTAPTWSASDPEPEPDDG